DARQLGDVGRRIGTAYQVIDDVLGTFGRPEVTGKSAESDLRAGKRTVLTAYAAQHDAFQAELAAFRRGASGVDALRGALRDTGAEAHAVDLAARLVAAALQQAENLRLEPALLDELAGICHHVLNREK
ncbi:MAG: polyprenyl synthetase family protein, partial [Arthrobacter sp.]|uniref:polyprenyl synthetase family protein n=1 Tax=Arthrobacter sp. TaxID=1667 RepID=UPI00348C54A3